MTPLNRKEQLLLAGLLIIFMAGGGLLAWQQQDLDSRLAEDTVHKAKDWDTTIEITDRIVSLMHADALELQQLPGIGPKLAEEIVHHRQKNPFHKVEDILQVSGIGPKRLEKIRDRVTLD